VFHAQPASVSQVIWYLVTEDLQCTSDASTCGNGRSSRSAQIRVIEVG
jgi:hypothetical protein